jgi:transposase
MFFPEGQVRVFLYGRPVDMRKSFTGRGDYLKCLYWDRTGFCLWAKRLERGRFVSDWARAVSRELDWTGLKLLLEGIEPGRRKARFERQEHTLEQSVRV